MRMVNLYWLDTTKPSHNGDCPEGTEKYIFSTNAGNLRTASHTRYAEMWPLGIIIHILFVGAATGIGTTSVVKHKGKHEPTARTAHCVPRCKYLMSLKHPEMLELPVKRFSVLSTERYGR